MNQLKSKVNGYNNQAILAEDHQNGTVFVDGILGVIKIRGGNKHVNLTKQVSQAIVDYSKIEAKDLNTFRLNVSEILTKDKRVKFMAEWEEDGEARVRDFIIFIARSY